MNSHLRVATCNVACKLFSSDAGIAFRWNLEHRGSAWDNYESWQAGNYESLWNEALEHVQKSKAAPRRKATSAPPDQQVARAKRLASEGLFSRACEALISNGLHDKSDRVIQALKALHPRCRHPVVPPTVELPDALEFDLESVRQAVNSFPKLSGVASLD